VIETLEHDIAAGEATLADPDFYRKGAEAIHDVLARLESDRAALATTYARWDELDSRA